jgi:hypothetical protein
MSKQIVIQGVSVEVSTPYAEGHTVTVAEAKALNQVRAENIRNNMASKVKEIEGDAEELSQEQLDQIAQLVSQYDAEYEFTMASAGGGRTTDPLEAEAKRIAKQLVSNAARNQGLKLKDIPQEKLDAKIAEVMELPEVQKAAADALKKKQKLAEAASVAF